MGHPLHTRTRPASPKSTAGAERLPNLGSDPASNAAPHGDGPGPTRRTACAAGKPGSFPLIHPGGLCFPLTPRRRAGARGPRPYRGTDLLGRAPPLPKGPALANWLGTDRSLPGVGGRQSAPGAEGGPDGIPNAESPRTRFATERDSAPGPRGRGSQGRGRKPQNGKTPARATPHHLMFSPPPRIEKVRGGENIRGGRTPNQRGGNPKAKRQLSLSNRVEIGNPKGPTKK